MDTMFTFERLDVWQVLLEALEQAHAIATAIPRPYGELADQIRRAAQSTVGNFGEGLGKEGKDRLRFHRIALGSAYESAAHLEAGKRLRLIAPERHATLRALLLRAVSMLTRMTR